MALMVEVLRDYLSARYAEAALSLTSTELQRSVRELPHVPHERLIRVLTEADLIKFARRAVSAARARELGEEARAIVEHEHLESQPKPVVDGEEKAA
jgi:DNA-directed RNA polymerase subunit K/omega